MLLSSSDKYGVGGEDTGSGFSGESILYPPDGTLVVYNVSLEDVGMYQCVVMNIHGSDSSEAQLYVQGLSCRRLHIEALHSMHVYSSIHSNCIQNTI